MRQSREIVSQFYADFDSGDIDTMVAGFSDGLETTDPGMGTVHGLAPFREYLETLKRALPDARAVVEQTHEAGDTVVVEGRFVGTFTGPLTSPDGDAEPTGASVDLRFADVSRVSDGKIVSYHTYYDQLGLLSQLGLMD
jgi:ketosteroid isomerase-like protein